ncbi:zinc ABC transporter substrate-binding protein [Gilvimarinus polysaccharolyticus]|uniref:zinc ABC transporter substrate-binding protein n=1 Tax=Gilvimarinus polysaccharolyticus TaxID=863921 RepID=UPI000ABDCF0A|nr:zinc ABC transporter substrate-binding protein [Gilvimarinus polysaccharolyticus]
MHISYFLRPLLLLALLLAGVAVRAQPLEVVVSVKPLAMIAGRVAGADAQIRTLLPPGVSPHDFALRVSDMRLIRGADLALWVGPELESFLQKPLSTLPVGKVITAASLDLINWPVDRGTTPPKDADGHIHAHAQGRDPHIWLDPANAVVVAQELALRLGQLRPAQAAAFAARAQQFAQESDALDARLQQMLAPVKEQGFAVYHDGYRHFVARYQLNQVDYVALTPEQRPGARHLYELEKHLQSEAACLFIEPYADSHAALALARRVGLQTGVLDPLASDVAIADYPSLMNRLAAELVSCLQ